METTVILVICALIAVLSLVGIYVRKCKTNHTNTEEDKALFGVEILAEIGPTLILRDDDGKLYRVEKKLETDNLGERIVVRPATQKESDSVFPKYFPKYTISEKDKGLCARVIRRLNKEVLLCEAKVQGGMKPIFVACSLEEQEKSQRTFSAVVAIKHDGNDRQVLKCQNVAELWVDWHATSEATIFFPVCCRA